MRYQCPETTHPAKRRRASSLLEMRHIQQITDAKRAMFKEHIVLGKEFRDCEQ